MIQHMCLTIHIWMTVKDIRKVPVFLCVFMLFSFFKNINKKDCCRIWMKSIFYIQWRKSVNILIIVCFIKYVFWYLCSVWRDKKLIKVSFITHFLFGWQPSPVALQDPELFFVSCLSCQKKRLTSGKGQKQEFFFWSNFNTNNEFLRMFQNFFCIIV